MMCVHILASWMQSVSLGELTGDISQAEDGNGTGDRSTARNKDASFLVFRQMEQLVPTFNKFCVDQSYL